MTKVLSLNLSLNIWTILEIMQPIAIIQNNCYLIGREECIIGRFVPLPLILCFLFQKGI